MSESLIFVAQEGRPADLVGVKLLCASIARHEPTAQIMLYVSQNIVNEVYTFTSRLAARVEVVEFEGKDWSCKPLVLLDALRRKRRRVTWIDTDVLLTGKASALYGLEEQTLAIAEESAPGAHRYVNERQKALNLPEGQPFGTTLSSAVLSVTEVHEKTLEMWSSLMTTDAYIFEQRLDKAQRTLFYGDQEVLEAVICSYRSVPVQILFNDVDLLQASWYDKRRKWKDRTPFAVHATGDLKPWKPGSRLNQEMFPYFEAARSYLHVLTAPEQAMFARRSRIATIAKLALGGFTAYRAVRRLAAKLPGSRTLLRRLQTRRLTKINASRRPLAAQTGLPR